MSVYLLASVYLLSLIKTLNMCVIHNIMCSITRLFYCDLSKLFEYNFIAVFCECFVINFLMFCALELNYIAKCVH